MIEQYFTGLPLYGQILAYLWVIFTASAIGYLLVSRKMAAFSGSRVVGTDGVPLSEEAPNIDIRYQQRKVSRKGKDVNRFGRWSLRLYNKKIITKVGFLYKVLEETSSVKTYREIK